MRTRVVWLMTVLLIVLIGFSQSNAQPGVNLLTNGGFEEGPSMPFNTWAAGTWNIYANAPGVASGEVVSALTGAEVPDGPVEGQYCLHVTVTTRGTDFWDIGLLHQGHIFQAGKKYTLSLFLKSKQGTAQVNIKPETDGAPYTGYGERSVTITNEWAEYSVTTPILASTVDPAHLVFHIGYAATEFWVDCVRFYEGDYVAPALPPKFKARKPNPSNGATGVIMPLMSWVAGDTAEFHDVYFGTTPSLGPADKKPPRLPKTSVFYYYTGTFTPGQTFYWRIDEVESNLTTIHTGDVWSFTAAPLTAYSPSPMNGARWIPAAGLSLTWYPGKDTESHDVYFGTNKADVQAGTGGTFKLNQYGTTYIPTGLADKTTYYWKVDEHVGSATHPGEVWSFQTSGPGGGVKAQYFPNMTLSGAPGLSVVEDSINHSWGDGDVYTGHVDNVSVRWTADLEVAFTGTYTFTTSTDDGVRLWVNGQLLIDHWVDQGTTAWTGTIDLVSGESYPLVMEYYESGGGAVAILSWEGPNTPKQVIPSGPLQLPVKANSPRPANGAVDITQTPKLQWNSGEKAAQHDIYFGTDQAAVTNATTTTTGIYKTRLNKDFTSYSPGALAWNTTYYWKIDEVNTAAGADSPWKGNVWSFTTANFIIVDDFEDYNDFSNLIYLTWIDGYGSPTQGIPGNGSGSQVGKLDAPYAEQTITHGGSAQSMPMFYNDSKQPYYSEAVRTWATGQDWTANGVKSLTLWYRGIPGSVGSIQYDQAADTYTMTGSGADIWGTSDEFHYAYKTLNGNGSIVARIDALTNTDVWAKAGVMIRDTLDPNSALAGGYITPDGRVAFQYRTAQGTDMSNPDQSTNTVTVAVTLPHWIKLTRTGNSFTVQHSADGITWVDIVPETAGDPLSVNISMNPNVYIGLAVTAHDTAAICTAKISKVSPNGTVTPGGTFTTSTDIGITSNEAEPLYVAIEGSNGIKSPIITNSDPNAVLNDTWQEWNIPLSQFTGVTLNSIKKMYIGAGNRANPKIGGTGILYFDDIRLYKPRCMPTLTKPQADFSNNCVVDYADLEILANNWLIKNYSVTPANPVTSGGLVAYYPLSNNAQDSSGQGHHGDPCGVLTYVPGPPGYGTAMYFGGAGNYVDLGTFDPSAGTGKLTVALWAKWDGLSGQYQGLIGKRDTWSASDMMWGIEANVDNGTLGFFREGSYPYDGDPVLPIGEWAHVAATFDGTTATFYLNGEKTGSGAFSFGSDTAARVQFGAIELNGNNPFNGALDEIRLYNRALTQGEVGWLAGKMAVYTQPLRWLLTPPDGAIDLNGDSVINMKDYAVLTNAWLEEKLWP